MKLHDPQTELELLRLAKSGRKGQPMEARDRWAWKRWAMASVWAICILLYIAHMMGAFDANRRILPWQYLVCGVAMLWLSKLYANLATSPIAGPYATLINLPVKGETLFKLARRSFFVRFAPWLIPLSAPFSYAAGGYTWSESWLMTISTALLAATTLATAIILYDASLGQSGVRKVYIRMFQFFPLVMLLAYQSSDRYLTTGGTPVWLEDGISLITWLLPASWCLPGRVEHGGGVVAFLWCLFGFSKWVSWPRRLGRLFDGPRDFYINGAGQEEELTEPSETDETISITTLAAPLSVPGDGWVERWVRRVIGRKDVLIAGVLVEQNVNWTKNTNMAICLCPVLLALNWVIVKTPNDIHWYESAVFCTWIVSAMAVPLLLQQTSNAVPRMMGQWSSGPQALPFLALLPINVRDVLRVSMRITFARTVILAAISLPYFWCLCSIHETALKPLDMLWLLLSYSWVAVTSRPLFILNRVQSICRCRGRMFLVNCALVGIISLVALTWLAASIVGIGLGVSWMGLARSDGDFGVIAALSLGGLVVSALCARAAFEIHRWRLKRNHYDWVSDK